VAHWASEFPWCEQAAGILRSRFGEALPVRVCTIRTDPWNMGHFGNDGENSHES
jgi:putative NIF3 family GTP cyclohydrolase 1 type 2